MRVQLDRASASEAGDYYQVTFEGKLNGEEAYVLVQRQFEFPDGGRCCVETHNQEYIGHFKMAYQPVVEATCRPLVDARGSVDSTSCRAATARERVLPQAAMRSLAGIGFSSDWHGGKQQSWKW